MKETIELIAIQLTPISIHIAVECRIGRRKTKMIIDTGASQTVMSTHFIEKAGFPLKQPESYNVTVGIGSDLLAPVCTEIPSLTLGKLKITNLPCIVLPMDHINKTYQSLGLKSIDGIIGNDLLTLMKAVIDMKKLTLTIRMKNKSFDFGKYFDKFFH